MADVIQMKTFVIVDEERYPVFHLEELASVPADMPTIAMTADEYVDWIAAAERYEAWQARFADVAKVFGDEK